MSEYYVTNDGELYHYGVVGMKWGVRRNATKAYERASKKMKRLKNKADKAKIKYGKKSGVHLTDFGIEAERKARKKAARADAKAIAWQRAMDKEFSNKKLSKLEQNYIRKGETYAQKYGNEKASTMYSKSEEIKKLRERIHGK